MKTFFLLIVVIIAILIFSAEKTVIQVQPGNSYLVYEFPRGVDKPWFRYDSRN